MARYYEKNLERWKAAYEIVSRHVSLTDAGQKLMTEFEQLFSTLESQSP